MVKFLFAILFLIYTFNSFAHHLQNNIEGYYDCRWLPTHSKKAVKGTMIIRQSGQTYVMKSQYNDHSSYDGTGILNQHKTNFALIFVNRHRPKEMGVALVDIHHSIYSTWKWANMNGTILEQTECLKRN